MASFAALAESISRLQNFDPDDLSAITEERSSLTSSIGSASIGNYSSSLRESIPRADSIREGPERRVSIVPTMDKIPIDTDNPAPKATLPSLDFDRVVNAFSIMAVKKRLTQQNDVHHRHQEMLVRHRSKENGYDTFGNQQEEDRELLQTPKDKAMTRWFLTLLTGIMCAVVAILIVYGVTRIGTFRAIRLNWHLAVAAGTSDWNNVNTRYNYKGFWWGLAHSYGYHFASQGYIYVFAMYASYNAFLALASAVLCIYFAPNAVGSGIPEVKAYLNGVCVESFADMNVFLTKIVATILSVSSGLIVGPEGPLVHLGAIIGQGVTKTTRLDAAIRTMQRNWPGLAGLLGMAPLHGPGETRAKLDGDMSLRNITKRVSRIEGKKKPKTFQRMMHVHNVPHDPRHSIVLAPNGLLTSVLETKDDDDQGSSNQQSGWSPNWIFISQFTADLSRFRNDTDRRDLISIGVATGFAAAFGAPVGGLLYSFEEASSYYSIPLMWRTLAATAIGTFVIAMYYGDIAQYSILSLGNPVKEGEADVEIHRKFAELPIYILIGIGGGLIGSFFNSCYIWTNTRRIKFYSNVKNSTVANFWNLFEVALVSLITSTVTFAMPVYLPQAWVCTDSESHYSYKNESGDWFEHQYNCPNGQFNEFAAILLGSRDEALDAILTDPTQFQSTTLLSCGLAFIFLMIVTFGVKLPCGLFMPSLLSGAMLGGWAGIILQKHVMSSINPAHLSLLGATALLAGIQRTTVSLCVIMMEATGQVKILIPLIISVVVARYVADIFTEGFYHINMELKEYPYLEHSIKESFDICTVSDVMSSPVVTLDGVEEVGHVEELLKTTKFQGFPVLDQKTRQYVGVIRRDQLVACIECGIFLETLTVDVEKNVFVQGSRTSIVKQVDANHDSNVNDSKCSQSTIFHNRNSWLEDNVIRAEDGKSILLSQATNLPNGIVDQQEAPVVEYNEDGNLVVHVSSTEERGYHLDCAAAMNMGAYTVNQNCPISKAYTLFTAMGLRHMPVLGRNGEVVGMITRSNFLPEFMEKRTGLEMH